MKGTEKILARIDAEARAQADGILARAEQACAERRAEYDAQAKAIYDEKLASLKARAAGTADSAVRLARMEAGKDVLALKQELVTEAFARAREQLCTLPPERMTDFLVSLAVSASVTGQEEIVLNERDRAALGDRVAAEANARLREAGRPAELRLADDAGKFDGGLMLRRGRIETNCTAELLLSLRRDGMSAEVAGILFA